eukprot:TRINITY_DN16329_c1_g1_i1.p1 TRINITY_DN16329_c1_g1~~TRINITY_DN16329_c1_g1_i1.p1  ORF type:complete len:164 (+),score=27.50 TRINITY_DN16329_c1_g1_i1:168-659(+)
MASSVSSEPSRHEHAVVKDELCDFVYSSKYQLYEGTISLGDEKEIRVFIRCHGGADTSIDAQMRTLHRLMDNMKHHLSRAWDYTIEGQFLFSWLSQEDESLEEEDMTHEYLNKEMRLVGIEIINRKEEDDSFELEFESENDMLGGHAWWVKFVNGNIVQAKIE